MATLGAYIGMDIVEQSLSGMVGGIGRTVRMGLEAVLVLCELVDNQERQLHVPALGL